MTRRRSRTSTSSRRCAATRSERLAPLKRGILLWNGTRLERDELSVRALWASSSRDVWAVGERDDKPAVFHFDGSAWSDVELPPEATSGTSFVDVVGRCASDVYLVTGKGLVHWDGARWTEMPAPPSIILRRAARVGSELWVVGSYELDTKLLLRYAW